MKALSKSNIRSALMLAETCTEAAHTLGCTRSYLANYMRRTTDKDLKELYDAVKRRETNRGAE